jgi:serpin B
MSDAQWGTDAQKLAVALNPAPRRALRRMSRRALALAVLFAATSTACKHPSSSDRTKAKASATAGLGAEASPAPRLTAPDGSAPDHERSPPPPAALAVAEAINQLADDLDRTQLSEGTGAQNLVFSPTSVLLTLGLAHAGARGSTRADLARVLHWDGAAEDLAPAVRQLMDYLGQPGSVTLDIANSYWLALDLTVTPSFREVARSGFSADGAQLDFSEDPDDAVRTINHWGERKTRGMIPALVPQGGFDPSTRMVLANAIYFLGRWAKPFNPTATLPRTFTAISGRRAEVPTLLDRRRLSYAETPLVRAVHIAYAGGGLSMIVALWKQPGWFLRPLPNNWLPPLLHAFEPRDVDLALPRFDARRSLALGNALKSLGARRAFTEAADFSGLATGERLRLSAVYHQARVRVDERGTEAAAATALNATVVSAPKPPVRFTVDQPFFFIILDRTTSAILFWGRIGSVND